MIKSIGIKNFKSIGQMAHIPLKPITLIFGPNSAGKSSIIQSMLMLKQTLAENQEKVLVSEGRYVDLGAFKEFIHNHDTGKELAFRFELVDFIDNFLNSEEDSVTVPDGWAEFVTLLQAPLREESVYITTKIVAEKETGQPRLSGFEFHIGDGVKPVMEYLPEEKGCKYWACANENHSFWKDYATSFEEDIRSELPPAPTRESDNMLAKMTELSKIMKDDPSRAEELSEDFLAVHENYSKMISEERKDNVIPENYAELHPFFEISPYCFLPRTMHLLCSRNGEYPIQEAIDINELINGWNDLSCFRDPAMYLSQASGCIQNYIENIEHIEPLRMAPKRYYSKMDAASIMQVFGGGTIFDYLANKANLQQVNDTLESIGINYALELKRFSENSDDLLSINLMNTRTGISSPLMDVGFGISQVLPIILSCISGKHKTFVIEQPELHLHPAAQTELGDLFIDSALGENKNSFVIETHSEHLILRLLRRIRETADGDLPEGCTPIKPDDIAVLYVQPGTNGAEVIELPVNEDGQFDRPWPEGFFAERVKELF